MSCFQRRKEMKHYDGAYCDRLSRHQHRSVCPLSQQQQNRLAAPFQHPVDCFDTQRDLLARITHRSVRHDAHKQAYPAQNPMSAFVRATGRSPAMLHHTAPG